MDRREAGEAEVAAGEGVEATYRTTGDAVAGFSEFSGVRAGGGRGRRDTWAPRSTRVPNHRWRLQLASAKTVTVPLRLPSSQPCELGGRERALQGPGRMTRATESVRERD